MSTTRRIFPEAFKREAADRVASSGLSVEKVATELVLRRWVKQFSVQATGPAMPPITQAVTPSPSDLVSEVPACDARTSDCGRSATS